MNDNVISLDAYRECPEPLRKRVKLSAFSLKKHEAKSRREAIDRLCRRPKS